MICTNGFVPVGRPGQSRAAGQHWNGSGHFPVEVRRHDPAGSVGAPATDHLVRRDHEVDAEVVAGLRQVLVEDLHRMHGGGDDGAGVGLLITGGLVRRLRRRR